MKKCIKYFIYHIFNVIAPRYCLFCANETESGNHSDNFDCTAFVCRLCKNDLFPIDQTDCCKRCGYPFQTFYLDNNFIENKADFLKKANLLCPSCKSIKLAFNIARSCYQYKTKLRRLLINFKAFFQTESIDFIGSSLLNVYLKMPKADIICFIPKEKIKLFIDGYNPAALIANNFYAHLSNIELHKKTILLHDLLLKNKYTKRSKTLSFYDRHLKNHAFVLNKKYLSDDWKKFFKGKTILIIDDIMTTGATLNAASFSLRNAFSEIKIECLTFARTMLFS